MPIVITNTLVLMFSFLDVIKVEKNTHTIKAFGKRSRPNVFNVNCFVNPNLALHSVAISADVIFPIFDLMGY